MQGRGGGAVATREEGERHPVANPAPVPHHPEEPGGEAAEARGGDQHKLADAVGMFRGKGGGDDPAH